MSSSGYSGVYFRHCFLINHGRNTAISESVAYSIHRLLTITTYFSGSAAAYSQDFMHIADCCGVCLQERHLPNKQVIWTQAETGTKNTAVPLFISLVWLWDKLKRKKRVLCGGCSLDTTIWSPSRLSVLHTEPEKHWRHVVEGRAVYKL